MLNKARDYDQFRDLIDAKRIGRGLRMRDLEVDANLQEGYFSKLISGDRNFGPVSLTAVLKALNVDISLIDRPPRDG